MLRDGLPPLGIVLDEDGIEGDLLGNKDQQVIEEFQGLLRRKATSQPQVRLPVSAQQLWLFELVPTG